MLVVLLATYSISDDLVFLSVVQVKQMILKDSRIKLVNEVLNGMKVCMIFKMCNYMLNFRASIKSDPQDFVLNALWHILICSIVVNKVNSSVKLWLATKLLRVLSLEAFPLSHYTVVVTVSSPIPS